MCNATTCELPANTKATQTIHGHGVKPILIVCFVGLCLTLLVYSPGYMSWDSLDQLQQARTGVFKDNHPPLMAAIWSIVDPVCAGPFGMLLLQTTMFWGGLALIFLHIRGPVFLRVLSIIVIGFYPPLFGLIGTLWKDLLMISSLLMTVGLLMRMERHRGVLSWLALVLFIMAACGFRHNAIVALPPLLVWLAHSFSFVRRKKRWPTFYRAFAIACIASLVVYFANSFVSKRLTSVNSNLWQGLAVFDIAGISVHSNEMLFPDDLHLLRHKATINDLTRVFRPGHAGRLYREWKDRSKEGTNRFRNIQDKEALSRLSTLWKRSILQHPGSYLKTRWGVFSHVIGWADTPIDTPIYGLYGPRIVENDLGLVFHPSRLNETITRWLTSISKTHVYRVWVYLVALFVFAAIGTFMYVRSGDPIPLALSSSGLLYVLEYFFFVASSNFRYSLWAILATLICAAYLLCKAVVHFQDRRITKPRRGERFQPTT